MEAHRQNWASHPKVELTLSIAIGYSHRGVISQVNLHSEQTDLFTLTTTNILIISC